MSNTIHAALEDIHWLSKRLQGIITLASEIDTYDTLKTQTAEFSSSLSSIKASYEEVLKKIQDKKNSLKKLEETIANTQKEFDLKADAIIAAAKTKAIDIEAEAEKNAQSLRTSAQADKQSIQQEINKHSGHLDTLKSSIDEHSGILHKLQQHIADLKAKF